MTWMIEQRAKNLNWFTEEWTFRATDRFHWHLGSLRRSILSVMISIKGASYANVLGRYFMIQSVLPRLDMGSLCNSFCQRILKTIKGYEYPMNWKLQREIKFHFGLHHGFWHIKHHVIRQGRFYCFASQSKIDISLCLLYRPKEKLCDIHNLDCRQIDAFNNPWIFRIQQRYDPFLSTRVGEAKNPGPDPFKLAIINPTAVLGKITDICTLECHMIALSENSATKSVQLETSQTWRNKGFRSIWSAPVAAHTWTFKEDEAKRGQASGVSIHSVLPIRQSRIPINDDLDRTRIISAIVQCGKWPIHIIAIYGYPLCQKDSKYKTNQLLNEAANLADQSRLPTMIVGDYNVPCTELAAAQTLMQDGYIPLDQLYFNLYGQEMPFTCREATRPDQALVHFKLIPFVTHIEVNKTKIVPDHDPIVLHLRLPDAQPVTQNWNLPMSWIPFEPDPELVEIAFFQTWQPPKLTSTENAMSDALKLWATTCEEAVDWTIRMQHKIEPSKYPQKCLPKLARGRNQTRQIVKKPITCVAKACSGQYDPQTEMASFRLRHKIRQLRRLQSFQYRVRKLQHLDSIKYETFVALQQEWTAITNAKGFKQGFPSWCIDIPEIGHYPKTFPDEDFLMTIIQLLRHYCDSEVAAEKTIRNKLSRYARQQDAIQNGLHKASKSVKGASNPNLAQTTRVKELPFTTTQICGGLATLVFRETVPFHFQGIATCEGQEVQFVDIRDHEVDVMIVDADQEFPQHGILKQQVISMEPANVAEDLTNYWNGFWKRDTMNETTDAESWTEYLNLLQTVPSLPRLTLDIDQLDIWLDVIKRSKSNSARGVDGWFMDEIKNLPPKIIQELVSIFAQHQGHAFGENDMKVITIPMGKTERPEKPAQTRPITLLGMLYRIWSKVSSKILLRQLQHHLPKSIIGFIPGRSMQLAMLQQQFEFEQLHQVPGTALHWEGVTLDIVKCFNAIARLPASLAMEKLGIPETWIKFWISSLSKTHRFWKIHEQLWEGTTTTTGCPEGDCWSILACLGLSYIWTFHITQGTTRPLSFADNWNWRSQDTESNIQTIRKTIQYLTSIKLDIDWAKTWVWCTRSVIKKTWKERLLAALPDVSIRVVTSARELGYTMHYNRVQSRYTQKERTSEAMKRWKRLQHMKLSLDDKGKIAHWALVKAFYATECYAVGQSWLQKSRTAITKCFIPNRKNTNPFLTLMLLTKHCKDPELFVIVESIRASRHLIWNMDPDSQQTFCQFVAQHTKKHSDVYGPAGALAYNLARLGWSMTDTGKIHTDTVVSFDIKYDAMPTIEKYLEHTWMRHMMQVGIQRPAWRNFPTPDRHSTLKIFSQIPDFQKRIGSYHLTGSCMMNDQKKHFTDLTESCQLCGKPDSETHRLLECFETNAVRQNYEDIVYFLQEHDICYHHLPVVWEEPNKEFDWVYFQNRPSIQIDQQVLNQVKNACQAGEPIAIYTDGSCNKICQGKTIAAAAVVCHPGCNLDTKKEIVRCFNNNQNIPKTFQVLGIGECSGDQTIPRAELQAVLAIASCNVECEIYTDSQYVIDFADKLKKITDIRVIHKAHNFDLLLPFWNLLQNCRLKLFKIKAHSYKIDDTTEQCFHKIGNMAADIAAKTARLRYESRHGVGAQDDTAIKLLPQYFGLLYDLHCARDLFRNGNEQKLHLGHRNTVQGLEQLQQWTVERPIEVFSPDDIVQHLDTCLWGTQYSMQVFRWLQAVQFTHQTTTDDPGVSWYEMTVDFLISMQCGVVINGAGPGENFRPRRLNKNDTDISFGLQVYSFERVVTQICRLLKLSLLPNRRRLCTSVKILGLRNSKAGLQTRPCMPSQQQTVQLLIRHFAMLEGDETNKGGPIIPNQPPLFGEQPSGCDEPDLETAWQQRHRRYQNRKASRR